MDEHIIRIHDVWYHWKMTIDLEELASSAGIKKHIVKPGPGEHYDQKVVSVPLPRAKRLLKLIREHGTEKDFEAVSACLRKKKNAKLYKYWRELCES